MRPPPLCNPEFAFPPVSCMPMLPLLLAAHDWTLRYPNRRRRSRFVDRCVAAQRDRLEAFFRRIGVDVMERDKLPKFLTPTRLFYGSLAFVIVTWIVAFAFCWAGWDSPEKRAAFGESFGVVSCLFTGVALVG